MENNHMKKEWPIGTKTNKGIVCGYTPEDEWIYLRGEENIFKPEELIKETSNLDNPKNIFQRFLVPLFTFIWWNRLWVNTESNNYPYLKRVYVYKVKNWRTAIVDDRGHGRHTMSFCFWWFK